MEETRSGILTTLVRIKGAKYNVAPVKSTKPIDKSLWVECSKALSRIYVGAPVKIGDLVCKNILNTGVDIICTKNIDREI
jgi:CxxC motif-containing protein